MYQRSFVYTGIARQLEECLRDLHIQSITNGVDARKQDKFLVHTQQILIRSIKTLIIGLKIQ